MFSNPFSNAFGLDVADLSIKVVQLRRVNDWKKEGIRHELVTARSTQLPPGLIVNGELQEPEKVRRYIQHLLKETADGQPPITSPWVVASLPEPRGFIKLIDIPKIAIDITEDDIYYAATQHLPIEIENMYLSWEVISSNDEMTQILLGVISKRIADIYTYLFESLGLGVIALEHESIATARSMMPAGDMPQNEAVAIIDLGAVRSSVILCDHNTIQFTTALPYSGELLTTALAQQLSSTHDQAEQKKREYGLAFKEQQQLWHIVMNEATESLALNTKKAIDFYYSHFSRSNRVQRIILCGGAAQLKHLDQVLAAKLNIPVVFGEPQQHIRLPRARAGHPLSLEFETSVGLALRAAENPFVNNS